MATIRGVPIDDSVLAPPPAPWPGDLSRPALLFGGTFDPPHIGHLTLAARARDALFGDDGVLVFVPAGRNPHKSTGPVASGEDRTAMLGLATAGDDRAVIWTDEIERAEAGSPSYWVDTLARAASLLPESTPLRFLIGADQAEAFDRWRAHETILKLAEPAVLLREPMGTREALRRGLQSSGEDPAAWMGRIVFDEVVPAVATDIRERLASGLPVCDDVDDRVAAYIASNKLYAG